MNNVWSLLIFSCASQFEWAYFRRQDSSCMLPHFSGSQVFAWVSSPLYIIGVCHTCRKLIFYMLSCWYPGWPLRIHTSWGYKQHRNHLWQQTHWPSHIGFLITVCLHSWQLMTISVSHISTTHKNAILLSREMVHLFSTIFHFISKHCFRNSLTWQDNF